MLDLTGGSIDLSQGDPGIRRQQPTLIEIHRQDGNRAIRPPARQSLRQRGFVGIRRRRRLEIDRAAGGRQARESGPRSLVQDFNWTGDVQAVRLQLAMDPRRGLFEPAWMFPGEFERSILIAGSYCSSMFSFHPCHRPPAASPFQAHQSTGIDQ